MFRTNVNITLSERSKPNMSSFSIVTASNTIPSICGISLPVLRTSIWFFYR